MVIRRILVPVDGSELADRAIEASVALAQQLGAAIVAFMAAPVAPLVAASTASPRLQALRQSEQHEHHARIAAQAQPVLSRFGNAARAAGVAFEGVLDEVPRVDRAIIAAAESHGCDLIVMVTHGRGAFGEFLFGSQTKAVLAGSKLPLLVLH